MVKRHYIQTDREIMQKIDTPIFSQTDNMVEKREIKKKR